MIVAYKKSELSHHGIYGMRWGERNGPPYPLGSGDHSASEKKAGWKKSLRSSGKPQEKRKVKSVKVSSQVVNPGQFSTPRPNSLGDKLFLKILDIEDKVNKKLDSTNPEYNKAIETVKLTEESKQARKEYEELEKLTKAKKEDKWDMDFLEYTQNEDYANSNDPKSKDKMLQEYASYLENPDKWLANLREQQDERAARNRALNEQHPKSGGFGFREIHESNGEKLAERTPPGYLNIKSEKELSKKELNKELDDFWKQVFQEAAEEERRKDEYKSGGIGDRGAGDILSKRDEARAEKVMNNIERNVQEIVNEIIGGKNNPKYPNREAMADKAAALRRQGLTNEQIAKKLGYESPSAISSLLKDKNVAPKSGSYKSGSSVNMFTQKDNKQASAEEDKPVDYKSLAQNQVRNLLNKGYTYREISDAMGLNGPQDVKDIASWSPVKDSTIQRKYNIDRGNISIRDAKANRHEYTTQDINDIVKRYNADKSVKDIIAAEDKAKRERALKFIKGVTEVSKTLYDASNEVDKWYKKFNGDKK